MIACKDEIENRDYFRFQIGKLGAVTISNLTRIRLSPVVIIVPVVVVAVPDGGHLGVVGNLVLGVVALDQDAPFPPSLPRLVSVQTAWEKSEKLSLSRFPFGLN